jgi:hypothetical protein
MKMQNDHQIRLFNFLLDVFVAAIFDPFVLLGMHMKS